MQNPEKAALKVFSCEEIQSYLKEEYNLGVFNLTLPFKYVPYEKPHEDIFRGNENSGNNVL